MSKKRKRRKLKVLFIDDELWTMQSTIDYLQYDGYEVSPVGDVSSACEALRLKRFDAIILDCMLPAGGLELDHELAPRHAGSILIKMIRSADGRVGEYNAETPILILTAISDVGAVHELVSQDIACFIQKPAGISEIVEALDKLLPP